jgi:hypothetical protein
MHHTPIDANEFPSPPLVFLLDLMGLPHDYSLKSIVRMTQGRWLQANKERWQFEPLEEYRLAYMLPFFRNLGCIEETSAERNAYDYALVLGGYYTRAELRIGKLIKEWERGVRFRRIVFLTGERFLDPETEKQFPCKTETDLMLHLWEKHAPAALKNTPLIVVDTPGHRNKDGSWRRPTTKDTVLHWLKMAPQPGACLAISSQPFVGYQHSVISTHLPSSFSLETIGVAEENLPLSVYLDNLARWLFQEQARRKECVSCS